ncbi:hypothetical protein JXA47_12060 [Candidatus Sumerlaeota bacterium]|nr:hypothetical protein [Candidatus Sumerlaeota bacterium]
MGDGDQQGAALRGDLEISEESAQLLGQAIASLLREPWEGVTASLAAPDVLLDLCAQYITNTRRVHDTWGIDELVSEYLCQMSGESWKTVRHVAARPRRGSPLAMRLYLSLFRAAARQRRGVGLGQMRASLLVIGAYLRGLAGLGSQSIYPLTMPLSRRERRRLQVDPEDPWGGRVTRLMLARHVESGGLLHAPNLVLGWRLALLAVAIARRGASALARARGEDQVTRSCLEQALEMVRDDLLSEGRVWKMLSSTSLIRDITERFLSRRSVVATLLGD